MKTFMILASSAIALTAVAHADPVSVKTPKSAAPAESAIYVADLEKAVKRVCQDETAPLLGLNFYTYQSCLKATRKEVAKKDPTGLYARRDSLGGTVVASK